jgi:hypothetical protein
MGRLPRLRVVGAMALLGCVVGGCTSRSTPQWVLVQSDAMGDFATPIYAWRQLQTFPTAEECARYQADLLHQAVSGTSREQLEATYRQHCLPASMMTPPAPR